MDCTKYDTFEAMVTERISRSLSKFEFSRLNENIDEWDEAYVKLFLNLYIQISNLPGISYRSLDVLMFEPVLLHSSPNASRTNEPFLIHSISIPYLKLIFNMRNKVQVGTKTCNAKLKLPSVFPLVGDFGGFSASNDTKVVSTRFTKRLLDFYVHADHAAYHHNQFITTGDADYGHEALRRRAMPQKAKEVTYCTDIISRKANKGLTDYLQSHDILRIEDVEVVNSRNKQRFGDMFSYDSSKYDEASDYEDEDED
ncbi:PmV-like [Penaeus vannamei nudivirus]|nr:hypothetical protein PvSNPV_029 [Penaeus vannamei nucleopolyhedrovirus]